MENIKYWLWLQAALREGARTDKIFSSFDSARDIYELSEAERKQSGVFTDRQIAALSKEKLDAAEEIINVCGKKKWKIITPDSEEYPRLLKNVKNFPLVLYCVGEVPNGENDLLVALVGARKASEYGIDVAAKITRDLTNAGATVVSGGALGIDSACHRAAIDAHGKTVMVLGHGFGVKYLMQNRKLWIEISRNGAVITEYRPFMPAKKYNFPMRNRIISGICRGTVVVEAAKDSGSLITAKCALDQGRDVFAVPGDITDRSLEGSNMLIRDGAKPVFSALDILNEYKRDYYFRKADRVDMYYHSEPDNAENGAKNTEKNKTEARKTFVKRLASDDFSDDEKAVYSVLGEEPSGVDEIIEKTGLVNKNVLIALTTLEMEGYIKALEGRKYKALPKED